MKYLDVGQTAEKWKVSERRVTLLCRDGRVAGARKTGKKWEIPEGVPLPPTGGRARPLLLRK